MLATESVTIGIVYDESVVSGGETDGRGVGSRNAIDVGGIGAVEVRVRPAAQDEGSRVRIRPPADASAHGWDVRTMMP